MSFRENLKLELKFKDIRVKELSEKTGISIHTINHYLTENGSQPQAELAVKIAQALDVSVEYLVTGKDSKSMSGMKEDVLEISRKLNYFEESDIELVKRIVERIDKS